MEYTMHLWGAKINFPPTFLSSSDCADNLINMKHINRRNVQSLFWMCMQGWCKNMRPETHWAVEAYVSSGTKEKRGMGV